MTAPSGVRATIVTAIEHYERTATGYGSLQNERSEALDRYLGRPYGDEVEGRSKVVMRDVADTVEWIKPSLLKVFMSGDEVVKFTPVGPEDEQAAEQETEYINHVLTQRANGFLVFHDWFHDSLLQKVGYVVVGWEEQSRTQREQYRGLTDDEFALLVGNDEIELVEHAEAIGPDGMRTHDAVVKQKLVYGCAMPRNVPPERVLISSDWPDMDLEDCPFVEVIEYPTISELREQGYDVADDINDDATSDDEWESHSREVEQAGQTERDGMEATPEMRRVKLRRVWMRYDSDQDGVAELRRVCVVGTTILEDEEDDLIPVACLTPLRQPHEHYGMSVADMVTDLQRIRTVLVRGFLDSMYLANSPRNAVDVNRVNLSDLTTSRVGGVVRVQGSPTDAVMPLQHAHQGPAILQAIEYVDTIRENRTGVTRYNQGLDANSLNKTATGVNQIMQAAQQRIELIARTFAETGVKALMRIMHAMSLKHSRQADLVKLRNQWVQIDPRQWKQRRDLTVSVGLGTGNKDQMLGHLMMILQEQKQALAIGLTRPELIYNTLAKLTQNAGFKMPDQFWSDPAQFAPPPTPPSPEQVKAQAEMQKLQFTAQQDQQKFQAEQVLEQQRMRMQAELDRNRQEWEARQKALEIEQQMQAEQMRAQYQAQQEQARLEFEKWKASLDANVKLQIAGMGQPTNEPDQRIDALMGMVQQVAEQTADLTAPPQIVRDETGSAVAVKRGKRVQKVLRGPDGRPVGLQ